MNERVLLAGCGDLGLRVAQRLLARGDEVWALRRHPPADDRSEVRWLAGDLSSTRISHALPNGISQMVYLATPDRRDEATYRAVFVEGLQNLFNAVGTGSLKRALLVSSSAVYGEKSEGWIDEDTLPQPPGFNGAVLLEAESLLRRLIPESVVLRLAGLYGPGRLQLLDRLRRGQLRVPRTSPHWANRIHVDDAASAVAHLLQITEPAPLYIGVDDTPLPLGVLYDHLAKLLNVPSAGEGPAPVGVGSKRLSNRRLRQCGWVPHWPDAREGYAALMVAKPAQMPTE